MYNPVISCRVKQQTYANIIRESKALHERKSKIIQHILDSLTPSEMSAFDDTQEDSLEVLGALSTAVQHDINQRKKIGNNVNQIAKKMNEMNVDEPESKIKPYDVINALAYVHDDMEALAKHDKDVDKEVSKLWRTLE